MNDIERALKCNHSQNINCKNCPYAIFMKDGLLDYCNNEKLHADAVKLIKKQQAEIEQLNKEKQERENPKPLTIKKLEHIELFSWVWIEIIKDACNEKSAYYSKHHDFLDSKSFWCGYPGLGFKFDYCDYGKTWLAYEYKPKERES